LALRRRGLRQVGVADRSRGSPQRDLRRRQGLPAIGRIARGETLHLDPQQLELGEIALFHPKPLEPLRVIEGLQMLLGQGELFLGDEHAGKRGLHLEDDLSSDIRDLITRGPGGRTRRVDPPLPFPPELDRLADIDRVLPLLLRLAGLELLRENIHRRVRPERGGDLRSLRRLQGELPGSQCEIFAQGQLEGFVEGYPRQGCLGSRLANSQHDAQTPHGKQGDTHEKPPRDH
jgi:hypothetical protein